MSVDLRLVAQRSGVSLSTASRALSDAPRISPATRARVREVADALGYRPNATARALRTARSQLVGLVVTNLVNASLRVVAEVVQQRLRAQGLQMVLFVTGGDPAEERAALRTLLDHNAVGVIVVGSDVQATDELHRSGLAVVHLARRPVLPAGTCVLGDEQAGAIDATEYLLGLGHRRIAVVAGPSEVTSGHERVQGFCAAMERARVAVRPELILRIPLAPQDGEDAARTLWSLPRGRRPTAVLIANHEAGFGVLPTLQDLGVLIPQDLSVLCYEDSDLTRWWQPAISVVDNDPAGMGALAATALLEQIFEPDRAERGAGQDVRVRTRLVLRGSCAPPRTAAGRIVIEPETQSS